MYEDFVKRLNGAAGGPEGIRMCLEAAAAITDMLVENQSMRNAADVSPGRHGRWEVVKGVFTPGGDPLLRCPFCKAKESEHLCGVESRVDWNYCPNCGAKMDAEG